MKYTDWLKVVNPGSFVLGDTIGLFGLYWDVVIPIFEQVGLDIFGLSTLELLEAGWLEFSNSKIIRFN